MRDIKFRGVSKEGKWVFGDLIQTTPRTDGSAFCWIKERNALGLGANSTPTSSFIELVPESVGQFTGITDYYGNEVYEKDILKVKMGNDWQIAPMLIENLWDIHIWINESDMYHRVNTFEVIGNAYQNPNLLKELL